MAKRSVLHVSLLLLLLSTPLQPTSALIFFTHLPTLLSLSHSLISRVDTIRASRGDVDGARRARLIASKIDYVLDLSVGSNFWSTGWYYLRNYAWRDTMSFKDAMGNAAEFKEFMSLLSELGRLRSDSERIAWAARHYMSVLRVSKSMFSRLLSVFSKSGPLRELVEILLEEMEGEFLKDILEVGSNDLKGVIKILKYLVSQCRHVDDQQEL